MSTDIDLATRNSLIRIICSDLEYLGDVDDEGLMTEDDPIVLRPHRTSYGQRAAERAVAIWQCQVDGMTVIRFDMYLCNLHPERNDFLRTMTVLADRTFAFGYLNVERNRDPEGAATDSLDLSIRCDIPIAAVQHDVAGWIAHGIIRSWIRHERILFATLRRSIIAKRRRTYTNNAIESALKDLDDLVGIKPVKEHAQRVVSVHRSNEERKLQGLKPFQYSPHLVFAGPPGTGKTTVARRIGALYKAIGVLSSGHVIETNRGDLVGQYIGHTAAKTRAACERALGGVLFIDEAYGLLVNGRDFGNEAVEELMTFMENNRGNFVVIIAGYHEPMQQLLASNPGLSSRFDTQIEFPAFSVDDLCKLANQQFEQHEYTLSEDAKRSLRGWLDFLSISTNTINGRTIRTLVNEIIVEHCTTLATPLPDRTELSDIKHVAVNCVFERRFLYVRKGEIAVPAAE